MGTVRTTLRITCLVVAVSAQAVLRWSAIVPQRATAWDVLVPAIVWRGQDLPYDARGADVALYAMKHDYMMSKETRQNRIRQTWPERDPCLAGSVAAGPTWDDENGRFLLPGIEYLNWEPDVLSSLGYGVVILSYDTVKWRKCKTLPFLSSGYVAEEFPYRRGCYYPWVRPVKIIGLPSSEIFRVSEYGRTWQVRCDEGP